MELKTIVHYGLLVTTVAMFVSGLGITEYRTMEAITGGLLAKNLAFKIHEGLTWAFAALLAIHLYLTLSGKKRGENRR